MDAISKLLNFALPPFSLLLLPILMLPSLIFKLLMHVRKSLRKENVANKVVLITGAASGIGEQIAYEYARRGAKLSLVDIRKEKLVAVSDKARSLGSPDVTTIAADVSKVQDCKRFVDETFNYFGRLDHLVNNAGISGKPVTVENMRDVSEYTAVMDVNFWGAVNATLFAIPHLKNSKGRIIVTSSVCGWFPLPLISIYNASKAAITNFFETLRMESGTAIGITIATPGFIKTDITLKAKFELKDVMRIVPLESASECAKAIVESACRGDMYVTYPSWYKMLFPWKVLHPQFVDWAVKLLCVPYLNKSAIKDNLMMPEYKVE
ncbi:11-beta-hydroxysteroid dehydrogenase-like 2 isoform X2 [Vigna radiata var. radiata]|uniref:11-beta-hydroxysteroid dehydrogenase-like 2 isoform X2 n=1 Tax=Vigna radiata var. radiata TaxID=3916 RepID=A0A1S3UI26_VIGRR|nr:11-beta-hydroxysteroid dehydrogenase-like 2 isoform X2 [Vigna radiata var. radiata]